MAEIKTSKHVVTNTSNGPRVLNSMPPVVLQAGRSTVGPVDISEGELASMEGTGYFTFEGRDAPEPGPLDNSIADLTTYLETVTDADEVEKLIEAETAGKSRAGAITALESRRDALLA